VVAGVDILTILRAKLAVIVAKLVTVNLSSFPTPIPVVLFARAYSYFFSPCSRDVSEWEEGISPPSQRLPAKFQIFSTNAKRCRRPPNSKRFFIHYKDISGMNEKEMHDSANDHVMKNKLLF
jgi:hypothetical protein